MQNIIQNIVLIISVFVSIFTLRKSSKSLEISKEKIRLDLYNKRFLVYEKILNYALVFMYDRKEKYEDLEIKLAFIKAYRESQYLFDRNSGVYEKIEEIKNICSAISSYHTDEFFKDMDIGDKKFKLERAMLDLEKNMKDYLQFGLLIKDKRCEPRRGESILFMDEQNMSQN